MIFPQGSELQLQPSSERSEYGKLALAAAGNFVGTPEFAQQYCIQPGDTIFVLGILSWEPCLGNPVLGTLQENPGAKSDSLAASGELSPIRPGFVREGEADRLRREAHPFLDPALPFGSGRCRREAKLEIVFVQMGRPGRGPLGTLGDSPAYRIFAMANPELARGPRPRGSPRHIALSL
jgi:hypothetical protein